MWTKAFITQNPYLLNIELKNIFTEEKNANK